MTLNHSVIVVQTAQTSVLMRSKPTAPKIKFKSTYTPKCTDCGGSIIRNKCMFELNPAYCPRHKQKQRWLAGLPEENPDE